MASLLGEIMRRKPFDIAAVYALVAWLIVPGGSASEGCGQSGWLG